MKQKLDKILGGFLVLLLAIIVVAVLWQVFSRYVLKSPNSYTEEVARYLLIWIGILGAAYASGQQEHLAIHLLAPKLNKKNKKILYIVINILVIIFSISVLIIGGSNLVYVNYLLGQTSAALNLPLASVYLVLPVSGVLIIIYKTNEIIYNKTYLKC